MYYNILNKFVNSDYNIINICDPNYDNTDSNYINHVDFIPFPYVRNKYQENLYNIYSQNYKNEILDLEKKYDFSQTLELNCFDIDDDDEFDEFDELDSHLRHIIKY